MIDETGKTRPMNTAMERQEIEGEIETLNTNAQAMNKALDEAWTEYAETEVVYRDKRAKLEQQRLEDFDQLRKRMDAIRGNVLGAQLNLKEPLEEDEPQAKKKKPVVVPIADPAKDAS